jgi:hypothetical protein
MNMDKTLCAAYGAAENLPSLEDIETANELQLRTIAKELLAVTQESRMSALHFKLQNSLISFTSNEAIKRAEVEQRLARREVEILQSSEYRNRHCISTPVLSPNSQFDLAFKRVEELEEVKATLERRLRSSKKLIKKLMEREKTKTESLQEEIDLLKTRIRENREHFSRLLNRGPLSASPRSSLQTPQRKTETRYPDNTPSHVSRGGSHDAFAALLAADQVLSGESASVSSTPSRNRFQKQQQLGHVRDSRSLPSLPATPERSRPAHESEYMTPSSKPRDDLTRFSSSAVQSRHTQLSRHDRDSTISISDAEEAVTDEEIPASQASSLATSMLRRLPQSSQEDNSITESIGKQSALLQAKLFGQVRKATAEPPTSSFHKRKASLNEDGLAIKKARISESVGLGINSCRA